MTIIVGTGQAGPSLAARLAGAGMKVAVIERKLFGGTCVNTGCIPTKTMVASAYAAHVARCGAEYGVVINSPVTVDMQRVKARKDEISGRSRRGVESWLRGLANCAVYQGHARLESPRELRVDSDLLSADRIILDVGGRFREGVTRSILGDLARAGGCHDSCSAHQPFCSMPK